MAKPKSVSLPEPVQFTDLRKFCRHSDRCSTKISLMLQDEDGLDREVPWIELGLTSITERDKPYHRYDLEARFTDGVTDWEHDSAKVICLPLIGLRWENSLVVYYHTMQFTAWIDPENPDDFRMYRPDVDPLKGAQTCKDKSCHKHPMIERFVPPKDLKMYDAVRGKRINISIGPVLPKEED